MDKVEPTSEQKKDGNLDPITNAPGAHAVGTGVGATVGGVAGIAGGVVASAATGLATGTVMGGPVGAMVGLVAGAVVGGLAGKAVGEKIDPTVEDAFWRDQHSKQPFFKEGEDFEIYRPAYQTGYEGPGKYGDRSFDELELELKSDYERNRGSSTVDWQKAKQATHAAWERASRRDESAGL